MENIREAIIDLLTNKAALKQDVADYSEEVLASFKNVAHDELAELRKNVDDQRVRLRIDEKGKHEFTMYVGSDVLVFQLHRNIFRLPDENPLWKTPYLEENGANGYFGIINIYNFLAESFEQGRLNDAGYLIGRIFVNHNQHFMVEGRGQLGFLFRDLPNSTLDEAKIRQMIQVSITHAIEFDLITPPYDIIQEVSVMEIQAISSELAMATGKRLGFKFSAEDKNVF